VYSGGDHIADMEVTMAFQGVFWKVVLVLALAGSVEWQSAVPQPQDDIAYEAQDGGTRIPPGP
jgi:hypothetical protein